MEKKMLERNIRSILENEAWHMDQPAHCPLTLKCIFKSNSSVMPGTGLYLPKQSNTKSHFLNNPMNDLTA